MIPSGISVSRDFKYLRDFIELNFRSAGSTFLSYAVRVENFVWDFEVSHLSRHALSTDYMSLAKRVDRI